MEASGEAKTRGSSGRVLIRHRMLGCSAESKVYQEYKTCVNQNAGSKMAFSAVCFMVASEFSTLTQR